MAQVSIDGTDLIIEIEGMDKLWAMQSRLTIPLANVRGATADPGIGKEPRGVRIPGTWIPGVLTAGTFQRDGVRVFWDVHDPADAVVIELRDERFARLIIQVADPRATVTLVEHAVRH